MYLSDQNVEAGTKTRSTDKSSKIRACFWPKAKRPGAGNRDISLREVLMLAHLWLGPFPTSVVWLSGTCQLKKGFLGTEICQKDQSRADRALHSSATPAVGGQGGMGLSLLLLHFVLLRKLKPELPDQALLPKGQWLL